VALPDEIKLPLRVHLRLATCRNLLMREARRSVERWGLTLPQFDVIAELTRAGTQGFTFVELSRVLLVTSGNLTGIVDRLEADGLVRRETDERDRRLVRIVLTKKGRQLADEIMPLHARDIQALLAFMPVERLTTLNEMLGHLRDGLRERPASGDAEAAAPDGGAGRQSPRAAARARGSSRQTRPLPRKARRGETPPLRG
jgi:DNA-binding MarR family transcriptional regulator